MDAEAQLAIPKSELDTLTGLIVIYKEELAKPVLSMTEICKSWMDQCANTQEGDALTSGFKDQADNPFKEIKSGCIIL